MEIKLNKYILTKNTTIEKLEKFGGGKATNLAKLESCGATVPPWICISNNAYNEFLEQFKEINLWSLKHTEIENLFRNGHIKSELENRIEEGLQTILKEGSSFAVRSSGIGEDSLEHSFAGQFSSYLNQIGIEQIKESIKLCWASAFTERAKTYREERKISTSHFSMGVIIQRMIIPDVAGVAFSRDPIHPLKREQMIISSLYGIGEGLVSGELDADHFFINRDNMKIESHLVKKEYAYTKNKHGGIEKVPVIESKQSSPSLDNEQITKIAKILVSLEEQLGLAQDVEWVIEDNNFFLVQTRPITNLPPNTFFDEKIKGQQYILWDNSNITESYNGVTSPLTFSHISRAYRQVYIQFCEVMGVPTELIERHETTFRNMLGLVRGRVYYNLRNWYQMIFLFPFSAKSNSFMETMMGVKQNLRPEVAALFDFTKNPPNYSLPRKIWILAVNIWRVLKVNTIIQDFKRDFFEVYKKAKTTNYSEQSVQELIESYNRLNEDLLFKWKAPIISDTRCMVFFGVLKSLTEKWITKNSSPSLYNDLLSGQGDLPSTEPTRILMRIAEKIEKGDEEIRSWFTRNSAKDVLIGLKAGKAPEVYKDFQNYIDQYGFRCINELKLESVDLHEDPTFAIDAILSFVKMKNISIDEIMEKEAKKSKEAEDTVRENISGIKKVLFFFFLNKARAAVKDREDLRLLRTNIFGICRRIFKALGQKYYGLGLLEDPMDIFYLSVDEIIAYQEGRSFEVNLKELSLTRKKQFDTYRKTPQPPDRFVTEGAAGLNFLFPEVLADQDLLIGEIPKSDDPNVLIGTPCSPGVVEGIVRVVREAEDAEGLSGEIMVSERTDPGWVPLFPSTSGLLIERGSLLSHSAVVARELGIPTIVGVHGGLMKKLKSGMRVRMDAAKGEIRILHDE